MARSAKRSAGPAEVDPRFADVTAAFAGDRAVSLVPGWGRGNGTLRVGEKIFALLLPSGLVAKLPRARVDALVAAGEGARFDPRKDGRVMREWVVVADEAAWLALAREARAHVASAALTASASPSPGAAAGRGPARVPAPAPPPSGRRSSPRSPRRAPRPPR